MPQVQPSFDKDKLKNIVLYCSLNPADMEEELHCYAKELLAAGKVEDAWQVLLTL